MTAKFRLDHAVTRGAGERNRTADLFITNEVHYLCATPALLHDTSVIISVIIWFVNTKQ